MMNPPIAPPIISGAAASAWPATHMRQVKAAAMTVSSNKSAANGTQLMNPVKQRVALIAGFLDSATPRTFQQSADLQYAANELVLNTRARSGAPAPMRDPLRGSATPRAAEPRGG